MLEILSRRKDICQFAFVESALVIPSKFMHSLIKPAFGSCNAKVYIFVGEKENRTMRNSAKIIHEKLKGSFLQVLPKMYHGEFSIHYVNDYEKWILQIVKQK